MKIGVIGDTHLGSTDFSAKRRADFSAAFNNAIDTCLQHGAECICLLGDVFDSAATRRDVDAFAEIIKEISPALHRFKRENIPVVAIPGNHEFGRGREAGELSALESLGFLRVLRQTEFCIGEVGICGVSWQQDASKIGPIAAGLRTRSHSRTKILLLHNFVEGSSFIPAHLWEVPRSVGQEFRKVFVGHHHVYERIGHFVVPGSIEVQNMLDESEKRVLVYDTVTDDVQALGLPRTHRVITLKYDANELSPQELRESIERDLGAPDRSRDAFVYLRVFGNIKPGQGLSRPEILSLLRERELFDYFIDLRYSTKTETAVQAAHRGSTIESALQTSFKGGDLEKAKRYLAYVDGEELFGVIREEILSGHKQSKA